MVRVHRAKEHDVVHEIEPVVPALQSDFIPSSVLVARDAGLVRVEDDCLFVHPCGSVGACSATAVVLEAVPEPFHGAL